MEISPAAKVGMVTMLAIIIVGITFIQLRDTTHLVTGRAYNIIFQRVEGLAVGAPVRLAGVQVGKVVNLSFTDNRKVKVEIDIFPAYRDIAITQESIFTIGQSFVGERWLEISPQAGTAISEGGTANGVSPVTMDEILAKSEGTLDQIDASMEGFNKFVNDPEFQGNIKASVASLKHLSGTFQQTARDASHLLNGLSDRVGVVTGTATNMMNNISREVSGLAGDFHNVAGNINQVIVTNSGSIKRVLSNVADATASLKVGMNKLQALLDNKQMGEDLQATLHNVRKASEDIQGIIHDVHIVTDDPKVQESLKSTFENANATVLEAQKMLEHVNHILGRFDKGKDAQPVKGPPQQLMQMNLESEWNWKTGQQSTNLNTWLLPHGIGPIPYGVSAGVDALGTQNLLNLQVDDTMGTMRPHFGVIRSQFGVGVDSFLGDKGAFSFDLYDPHNPQLDMIGRYYLKDFFLMGGVRDTLHDRNPVFGVGKEF